MLLESFSTWNVYTCINILKSITVGDIGWEYNLQMMMHEIVSKLNHPNSQSLENPKG